MWVTGKILTSSIEQTFFFSSRRRHTRFDCDWSSDVCSSDLDAQLRRVQGTGYRVAVGIELRPDPRDLRNRTRIQARGRIDRSRQAVHQRLVEHVVGHLTGRIPGATRIVEQREVEASESWLVLRQ